MAFEVVKRGSFNTRPALAEGWARITKSGVLVIRRDDLRLVGIDQLAVVLLDVDSRRIALQAPNDDHAADARRVSYSCSKVGSVTISSALKSLGLKPAEFGPREIEIMTKGPRLIVALIDVPSERGAAAGGGMIPKWGTPA